jgi:hypothetical protein
VSSRSESIGEKAIEAQKVKPSHLKWMSRIGNFTYLVYAKQMSNLMSLHRGDDERKRLTFKIKTDFVQTSFVGMHYLQVET